MILAAVVGAGVVVTRAVVVGSSKKLSHGVAISTITIAMKLLPTI